MGEALAHALVRPHSSPNEEAIAYIREQGATNDVVSRRRRNAHPHVELRGSDGVRIVGIDAPYNSHVDPWHPMVRARKVCRPGHGRHRTSVADEVWFIRREQGERPYADAARLTDGQRRASERPAFVDRLEIDLQVLVAGRTTGEHGMDRLNVLVWVRTGGSNDQLREQLATKHNGTLGARKVTRSIATSLEHLRLQGLRHLGRQTRTAARVDSQVSHRKEPTLVRIQFDRATCTGHGRCYTLSASVYEPDDDGYGSTPLTTVPPELEAAARLGAANCPERAIRIVEDDSAS
jgi:ferredoxin